MELIEAGRALYLTGHPGFKEAHLWFVLTEPDSNKRVISVPLLSECPHTDKTVVLQQGDHPFIQHRSNVGYDSATFCSVAKLKAAIKNGRCDLRRDVSPALMLRLRIGLLASHRTCNELVDYCQSIFGDALCKQAESLAAVHALKQATPTEGP